MIYKVNLEEKFNIKKLQLEKFGYNKINCWKEEMVPVSEIAKKLNRSYWGIADKIRRLNNK